MTIALIALIVLAAILLVLHGKRPNPVMGCAILGVIVGIIISFITGDWWMTGLGFVIGTFTGTIIKWLRQLVIYLKYR